MAIGLGWFLIAGVASLYAVVVPRIPHISKMQKRQGNLMKSEAIRSESYLFAYAAWMTALVASLGSLFFGEVMKLPPCSLCWYQRICLFPLTVLIAVGIALRDKNLFLYATPLVAVGLGLALYHNLIYYGVVPEALSPCTQGVPCSSRQIEWLGFITIPLMALFGFLGILVCLMLHRSRQQRARA